MASTCATCGTENRDFAKFCIECIATLPTSFAPTEFSPRLSTGARAALEVEQLRAAAAAPPPPPRPAAPAEAPSVRSAPVRSKGLWVSVAAFAIALVVGAGGWVIAGAGGWYIYSASASPAAPAPAPVAAYEARTPVAPAAAAFVPVEPPRAEAVVQTAPATDPPEASAAKPLMPKSKAPPAVATGTAQRSKQAPPAAVPAPVSSPRTQCAGRSFFASARCMAEHCARPGVRQHPECEAVREQQRLMEEKRNPTLAN